MSTEVLMPRFGESVEEATITRWLKREGETVEEYEPLLEVNTDKVDTEVPAPVAGTLLKRFVSEGETVSAGTLLAVIGEIGEKAPDSGDGAQAEPEPAVAAVGTLGSATPTRVMVSETAEPGRLGGRGFVSPVVARIAADHGIDLTLLNGTGRGGRITKKDVLAYVESRPVGLPVAPAAAPPPATPAAEPAPPPMRVPGSVIPIDAVRKAIAEHMVRSKHTSPHVSTVMEADLRSVVAHRQANKESFSRDGVNLTFTAYFVAAAVEALRAHPIVNSSWRDEGIVLHRQVNIGVATSLGEVGLIVPVVKGADQMSLLGLARSINDLAGRARARQLKPDEVQGGTFTITNHGVSGSLFATPIINQPQCAILGVGTIQKRVVVVETEGPMGEAADAIVVRPMVYLSLTFDHRILDGVVADTFLGTIVRTLEGWK